MKPKRVVNRLSTKFAVKRGEIDCILRKKAMLIIHL